jgi:hypothetical protein
MIDNDMFAGEESRHGKMRGAKGARMLSRKVCLFYSDTDVVLSGFMGKFQGKGASQD